MSKDSALITILVGALVVITGIATTFYITHPAAAAILAQMAAAPA
jgi:hypothetical protein